MKKPLFSIVTPVYNNTLYLEGAVKSVLDQSFSDFEMIIVDDGSTDGTPELVDYLASTDSRIKVIHQNNQWIYASYNNGVAASSGEYILFVNSDDFLRPGILEYAALRIEEYNNPDVLWASMVINICDKQNNFIERDTLNTFEITDKDLYFPTADDFRNNWMFLYLNRIVRNPVNFYKREILIEHPFRNDVYGADFISNIEIAPYINTSVLLAMPAYDYCDRQDPDNPDTSGMRYYDYENDMFNEIYIKIKKNLSDWGIYDSENRNILCRNRLVFFVKTLACLSGPKCTKAWFEKVSEAVSFSKDTVILECISELNGKKEIFDDIVNSIRGILFDEFAKSKGTDRTIFRLLDGVLSLQERGKSSEEILGYIDAELPNSDISG